MTGQPEHRMVRLDRPHYVVDLIFYGVVSAATAVGIVCLAAAIWWL